MFMSQGRGIPTDQLTNVIQVLRMGRKSGQLNVERGEGMMLERGEIAFANGQITQAHTGELSGQQAFNKLNNWGACRFTFTAISPPHDGYSITPQPQLTWIQSVKETNPALLRTRPTTDADALARQSAGVSSISIIPKRIRSNDMALHLLEEAGLSRLHRSLFFLIDGKRTTTELTRLMARSNDEVRRLLLDLERIGIIQQ